MKVIFLDIDGVVNCRTTPNRYNGVIGIDPEMAFRVGKICLYTDAKIVLSSSWRHYDKSREEVRKRVEDFIDITPTLHGEEFCRGDEILQWLSNHPEVEKYAILDDDDDMLPEQMESFFQTSWETGITDEIMNKVISYLNA